MFRIRLITIVLAVLGFGLIASSVAFATVLIYGTSATYYCDAVIVTYSIYGVPAIQFRVVDSGNSPLSPVVNGPGNSTLALQQYTITIELSAEQSAGTVLKVQENQGYGWYDLPGLIATACSGLLPRAQTPEPETPPAAPMYSFFGGPGVHTRLFVVYEDNGANDPVLAFYHIEEDSTGVLLFYISANSLAEYPEHPDRPILVHQSDDGKFTFYILPSGEYQVNVGPDTEGKIEALTFTGIPPQNVILRSFNVYGSSALPASPRHLMLLPLIAAW